MFSQQRKLLLLVFLWACLCIVIFKSSTKVADSKHQKRALTTTTSTAADNHSKQQETSSLSLGQQNSTTAQAEAAALKPLTTTATTTSTSTSSTLAATSAHERHKQCDYNYPNLSDLQFNNIHWQIAQIRVPPPPGNASTEPGPLATFYLYNAYYDDRRRGGLPSVRVLAMIDRIHPPPTHCLLWSAKLRAAGPESRLVPLVSQASFVYAWYPKWGNYQDGLLQPWIVTCQLPRSHRGLVPDSVSLVGVPPLKSHTGRPAIVSSLSKREVGTGDTQQQQQQQVPMAMPASFSSSSPSVSSPVPSSSLSASSHSQPPSTASSQPISSKQKPSPHHKLVEYDCSRAQRTITNNLPVFNRRPKTKEKFAVCVKGLDFPHEDVSVRLVEWIELLNLLGAGKIFLYELDVHENISKVLHYYQERGMVELTPLTLPGNQPNLPEYQHLYLKSKLTNKRQNELIPYNDCLYRNLNSYQYLALLDIDEIIMPLGRQHNWFGLMEEVERMSLAEQNYSRASYNVRNVYFFDDLAGPLGTTSSSTTGSSDSEEDSPSDSLDSDASEGSTNEVDDQQQQQQQQQLEQGIPHYLHMMQHVYRSKNYTKPGQYVKCFHNTERVVSLHNHFPMNCFGQCTTYSVPVELAHLQHYRKDCVGPLRQSCKSDFRKFTMRDTTIWKYKQQMIRRTTRVLNHLGLMSKKPTT